MVKHGKIPDRWLDYTPIGKRIEGTRFVAFKVPLRKHICDHVNDDSIELHLDKLLDYIPNLGLIIDLTNTSRYYDSSYVLKNGVKYLKVACPGKQVPTTQITHEFNQHVKRYLKENQDNGKLIGVHCTHGVNRTGFLICSFMVTELKMDPLRAITNFEMARGHSIERLEYRNMILNAATRSRKESWRSRSSDGSGDYRGSKKKIRLSRESSSRSPVKSIDWKRIPKDSEEKNSSARRLSRESYTRRSSDRKINLKRPRKDSGGRDSSIPLEPRWVPTDRNRNPRESSIKNGYYNDRHDNEFSYDNRAKRPNIQKEYQNNAQYDKGDNQRKFEWKNNRYSFNRTNNPSFNARGGSSRFVYIRKEAKGNEYQAKPERSQDNSNRYWERKSEYQGRWQKNPEPESSRDRAKKDEYQGRQERNQGDSNKDYGRRDDYQGKPEKIVENSNRVWERKSEYQGRWEKNEEEFGRDRAKKDEYQGRQDRNQGDSNRDYGRRDDYQGRQKRDEYQERHDDRERKNEYQGRQRDLSRDRKGRDDYQGTDNYRTYKLNRSNPFKTKPRTEENDRNYPERYEKDNRRDEWEKKDSRHFNSKAPHPRELPLPRWKSERNERDSSRQNYLHVKSRPEEERQNFREIGKIFNTMLKSQPRWTATHADDSRRN